MLIKLIVFTNIICGLFNFILVLNKAVQERKTFTKNILKIAALSMLTGLTGYIILLIVTFKNVEILKNE